jgi:hypothetical protein
MEGSPMPLRATWKDRMRWFVSRLNEILERGYNEADIETGV